MTVAAERPNRLRELRDTCGWTQQEMAERIARLAWMRHRTDVGVNADMIAKWERGAKGVSPRYRGLLCELFAVTAEQLGLGPAQAERPSSRPPAEDHSLVSLLDNAASLLDQLGSAGTVLAPQMLAVWKDAVTSRRAMFAMLDPSATEPAGHARAATASTDDWEILADRYQALYVTAAPAALLTPVAAHVRMVNDALRRDPEPAERRRLLRNLAQVAILAGRLSFDDLGDAMSGRAYYSLAIDTAREAADDPLAAIAHGHAAQLAATDGQGSAALDHLTAAAGHAGTAPAVRSWLATTEATVHADAGNHLAARDALDRAASTLSTVDATPAWFDEHGPAALAAAAGHVLLRAGDHAGARKALAEALDRLDPRARRQRALCLIDQATAELHAGNPDEACALAASVADLLGRTPYATGTTRLRAFRADADRALGSRALHVLDQHLAHLAA